MPSPFEGSKGAKGVGLALLSLTHRYSPVGAYAIAEALLGNIHLSPTQSAQLRALDRKYYRHLDELERAKVVRNLPRVDVVSPERTGVADGLADLEARISADVLAMLTPEQRRVVTEL